MLIVEFSFLWGYTLNSPIVYPTTVGILKHTHAHTCTQTHKNTHTQEERERQRGRERERETETCRKRHTKRISTLNGISRLYIIHICV